MNSKGPIRDPQHSKEGLFRLLNEKKHGYHNSDMQSLNLKDYQMNLIQPDHNARSAYSLQFSSHDGMPEVVLPESNVCVDSSSFNNGHARSFNGCIPIGQAFPQMLGGISDFRKNLMVSVQTDVSPRDVLQGQGALCVPPEASHLHQPVEQLERQRQRNRQRMKTLRLDPDFRAQERLRQRQRMFLKRQDPQFREKERVLQRVRVREKRNMLRALESGNGLLERLASPSAAHPRSNGTIADEGPSLCPTEPSPGSSSQSNGTLTVYGTLVEGSQLSQHLLLPHNHSRFLMTGEPAPQGQRNDDIGETSNEKNPVSPFNFDLCRSNMLSNCKVCTKLYQDLCKHVRGHKRNHRCPTCGRVFRLKQHLKGHMKTHGDKHLACQHCSYRTCYNFALNRHLILKHGRHDQAQQHPQNVQQCQASLSLSTADSMVKRNDDVS